MAQRWLKQLQASNAQNAINANSSHNQMDADNDGKLSAAELAQACNLSLEEAQNIINQYDANGDGYLQPDEFEDLKEQILAQQTQQITNVLNANTSIQDMDQNYDGKLSANELAQACNISVQEAQNIIMQYDANGDGLLDKDEFEDLKNQILEQQRSNMTNNINANDEFDNFDNNGDGKLSANELAQACNISFQEAQNIIMQYDQNGDGLLDANEFEDLKQQILEQQRQGMTNKINANDVVQGFDKDGDGKLSANELAQACNISFQEAQNIIMQYDQNGDGLLDENEFEDLKQQILEQQRQRMTNNINANDTVQTIDANGDGKLSAIELANACNISAAEAQNIIMQYDQNGDGMLDQNEFEDLKQQILAQQRNNMTNNINANDTLNTMDANNDGKLSANELAQACNISVQEATNIIMQYDVNGDGMLDQQEFEDLKQQILEQQRNNMTDKLGAQDTHYDIDADGDGKLDANELAEQCNISVQEAQNIIYQYDQDGDGKLDKQEFEQLKQQVLQQQRDKASNAFANHTSYNQFDANNDGKIDANELAQQCNITVDEAERLIEQNDNDGDGYLDQGEFEELKQRILEDQRKKEEEKNQQYQTPYQDPNVAAYQSAVYNNNQPQMQLNNSNGRDQSGSTFVPYNQADNKPKFAGDINQVDSSQFNPQNSNAKAFGVDIFANEKNNNPQQKQASYINNTNSSPFGNPNSNNKPKPSYNNNKPKPSYNNNNNASPFGKPSNNNSSPFGSNPNSNNNRPNQPQNSSPFGNNPNANNRPAGPSGGKPQKKYAHQWSLGIKFDVQNDQIIITVKDDATHKTWRKFVGKQETYGKEVKQEYFRIGKIINNGDAKYTYPQNGIGPVQVNLTHGHDGFNFSAPQI